MRDSPVPNKISNLILERYLLDELPEREARAFETRLANDSVLRERLEALKESSAEILRGTPPELFAQRLQALDRKRRAEESIRNPSVAGSSAWSFAAWKPLLGSLALLTILAIPISQLGLFKQGRETQLTETVGGAEEPEGVSPGVPASPSEISALPPQATSPATPSQAATSPAAPEPTTLAAVESGVETPSVHYTERLKGLEPHLAIFRKTDSGAQPVRPGEKAHPGEVLRIGYQAAGFPYGAILSVDGNGSVTRHWPATGKRAGLLETGDALLPSSFELDAAPDYERFYFVVSKKAFELGPLVDLLNKKESLIEFSKANASKETRIVRFEILKENGI